MTVKLRRRSTPVAALVVGALALSACGASAPGANELAYELIDTLEVSDSVKDCMRGKVDQFEEDTLDKLANQADDGDAAALEGMDEFEAALAACN